MEISGNKTSELQICDVCAKTYVDNKPFILLAQRGLDTTKIDDQDESVLHAIQSRNYGSIVDDEARAHSGK